MLPGLEDWPQETRRRIVSFDPALELLLKCSRTGLMPSGSSMHLSIKYEMGKFTN